LEGVEIRVELQYLIITARDGRVEGKTFKYVCIIGGE
jgi:hypothetical protein